MNCGWAGTIQQFLQLDKTAFIQQLQKHVYQEIITEKDPKWLERKSQITSWEDTFDKFKQIFQQISHLDGSLIFEYDILRGSGRRPDVVLILNGTVIVIECKRYNQISKSECIQTSLYVRDLQLYHSEIHRTNTHVIGVLFLTNHNKKELSIFPNERIYLATIHSLPLLINKIMKRPTKVFTLLQFLNGVYEPSPSVLEAARAIFNNEPLPKIKAFRSSNFSQVEETIYEIIKQAKETNSHHLVLVSGEPGSGKTYLGLKIAHNMENAVYLSGNGPLVDVLQDTLKTDTFVQDLYGFKMYFLEKGLIPHEQIIIFDEAQRAWDQEKVNQSLRRKNMTPMDLSEPDIIMEIATTNKPWSVTIGLIGEGQEIYSGEEGGLKLWNEAIANRNVIVHARHHHSLFTNAFQYFTHQHLHLNYSFRAHAALKYYEIINSLLEEKFTLTKELMKNLAKDRYYLFITRDLEKAKKVVRGLYQGDRKTVGIVCASGADLQKEVLILPPNKRNEIPPKIAKYFNCPDSIYYCSTLNYALTEFQTQGLELDMTIVHWDDDLYIMDGKWHGQHFQKGVQNKLQIKLNAYRVLLTRGRDGTIIYIPKKSLLEETWDLLKNQIGIPEL